jgi:hypothetical protein
LDCNPIEEGNEPPARAWGSLRRWRRQVLTLPQSLPTTSRFLATLSDPLPMSQLLPSSSLHTPRRPRSINLVSETNSRASTTMFGSGSLPGPVKIPMCQVKEIMDLKNQAWLSYVLCLLSELQLDWDIGFHLQGSIY